jgi:flavin reductase (DIM6/NTAB) family NADH-FMN oxidoreductase RutF
MTIDPKSGTTKDIYHLMTSCVVPRPIALVTSVSPAGIINAAPFSYFNAVSSSPPMIMISVGRRTGEPKDTAVNIRHSKEFVVNIVNERVAAQMNMTSGNFPSDVSEVEIAGLTLVQSESIKTPRIAESPIHLECLLSQVLVIGSNSADLILGEVVRFHIDDALMENGRINQIALKAVGRLSGSEYCKTTEIFSMRRPTISPQENS